MEKLKSDRQAIKGEGDQLEQHLINTLLKMGVTWVDESQNGSGPFWVISKEKSDGSFNHKRYVEFFNNLVPNIASGKVKSADQCAELAVQYLKQFEKRSLGINQVSQIRTKRSVEELNKWIQGK